ncbi:MAG TPA: YhdP family protein [Burkholderiales bacterium]|nr:YhdP family protein [Burkholderiales bacterium]
MSLLHDAEDEAIEAQLPPTERRWLKWLRRIGWTLVTLYFVAATAMLALRFWVLPAVADHKPEIEAAISRALGLRVEIAGVTAEWFGFHPRLELTGVKIFDARGTEGLALEYVGVTVAWISILAGELRFDSVVLERPELVIRRDAQGTLFIAGIEMKPDEPSDGVGLTDWPLRQAEIIVREATVEWQDDLRRAVPLKLERVDFLLQNDGRHHRFALRAQPPRELGSPLELRGDLTGRNLAEVESWNGKLYAAFDYVDLAVWQAWVNYPFEVRSGRGALRLWLGFADRTLTELTASVGLDDVAGRFAPDLPLLEMRSMRGQFGIKKTATFELIDLDGQPDIVYEAFARQLSLVAKDGVALAPADFTAKWWPAQTKEPARGEFTARSIELGPLAHIGEYVPLPAEARKALVTAAPTGRLSEVTFVWTGVIERPTAYTARGKFGELGMRPYNAVPGFERLAGSFDVSEKGGTVALQAPTASVESAKLFPAGPLSFDSFTARVTWTFPQGDFLLKLDDVAFANADLAGSVSGTYRGGAQGARVVDFTGRLARGDGRQVYKYIPDLDEEVLVWLKQRILAGTANETKFRLRGDMRDFPFREASTGEFRMSSRVTNGTLDYADGWPKLTNVTADILFDGPKLRVTNGRASVLGAQVANTVVTMPDLYRHRTDVIIDGEANGPLGEFLRFIAESPVSGLIGGLTDKWSGDGRANLKAHLALPLYAMNDAKAAGSVQLANNSLALGPGEPTLTQVNGRVDFTDAGVSSRGVAAQTLGGNINLQLSTRDAVTTAVIQGTVDSRELARTVELPIADRVRGPLPFRYTATASRARTGTNVFESTLAGVAVDLPAPFAKPAAESWPFRLERTATTTQPRQETIALTVGAVLNAQAYVRYEGGKMIIERASVGVGDVGVPVPERPGVFIAGNLKALDFDRLLAAATDAGEKAGAAEFNVTALNLRAGSLVAIGREFHDVSVRAQFDGRRTWRADVTARELAGEIAWRSEGQGLVRARLKHLIQPERAPGSVSNDDIARELPALAISADSYTFNGNELGRLELRAVNEAKAWRLEKLELAATEGTLSASGLWDPSERGAGRTRLDVKADVKDVGKYLERFGHPETVAKGTATLGGTVEWAGPVYRIDYGTLTGNLDVKAEKGQFVKVKPGVGRLLGVLSLQSLPRRMSLDFHDVFSEGFAFDSIAGSAKITQGVATTDNLAMVGPAASVAIAGRADLAKETQDLTVRVVPVLGDSVAIAAGVALLNPLVGAGALIAQRLFKDPLGQMFAYEYQVTGSWEDPKVLRVRAPEVAAPGASTQAAPESGEKPTQ